MKKHHSYISQTSANAQKRTLPGIRSVFVFLIVLLFFFAPLLAASAGEDSTRFTDYLYLYTISSYALIVLGIIIFREKNLNAFQDHFSLWMVVGGCFLAASRGGEHDTVYRIFLVLLGIRLSIYILANRKSIRLPNLKSVFIGLLWSVVTITIIAFMLFFSKPIRESLQPDFSAYILNTLLYQISFVTVIEEASFRGLLFGLLVMSGYQEDKALTIQAILFWGVHYMRIGADPALFFIAVPMLTLSLSLVIKKYKMLYLSVVVHTLANVLGPVFLVILQNSRL